MDAPFSRIDFLEILQFDVAEPSTLYDLLNLGLRITPTAGSDFPCFPAGPPGSQRFYTRVEGIFTYSTWLDGLRRGRTFATNGPLLEFSVDGVDVGGEVSLDSAGTVRVVGRARFDPGRDDVTALELIKEGEVVYTMEHSSEIDAIQLDVTLPVEESTWFALRATGRKVDARPFPLDGTPRPSSAHTGALYVEVAGTPPLAERPLAAEVSRRFVAELDQLAKRFSPAAIESINGPIAEAVTGIDAEVGRRDREAVLEAIEAARDFYSGGEARAAARAAAFESEHQTWPLPP
jgi:hypothetical protein